MTGESLYRKVADDIKAAIAAGAYPPGRCCRPRRAGRAVRGVARHGAAGVRRAARRRRDRLPPRRAAGGHRRPAGAELRRAAVVLPLGAGDRRGAVGRVVSLDRRPATAAEARRLGLSAGEPGVLPGPGAAAVRPAGDGRARPLPGEGRRAGRRASTWPSTRSPSGSRQLGVGVHRRRARHRRGARVGRGRPAAWRAGRRAAAARAAVHHGPFRAPVEWSDDRYLGSETAFSIRNSVSVNALSRTSAPPR